MVADSLIYNFKKIAKKKQVQQMASTSRIKKKSFKIMERYQGEIELYVIIIYILL